MIRHAIRVLLLLYGASLVAAGGCASWCNEKRPHCAQFPLVCGDCSWCFASDDGAAAAPPPPRIQPKANTATARASTGGCASWCDKRRHHCLNFPLVCGKCEFCGKPAQAAEPAAPLSAGAAKAARLKEKAQERAELLVHAAEEGDVDELRKLLDEPRAHRVNAVLEGGRTALHAAVERGHLAAVKLLLERGADTRREEAGLTPLAAAVYYGWPSTTAAILEAGANPMRTMRGGTHKGQTALEIAEKRYEGVDRKGFTTDHWARAILEKGKERWRMAKGELR